MKRPIWFAAKTYGVGAGLPVSWQGWGALIVALLATAAAAHWLQGLLRLLVISATIIAFATVALLTAAPRGSSSGR
jgi:hypothetical protein